MRLTCRFDCDIVNCELHGLAHQDARLGHRLPELSCDWKNETHTRIAAWLTRSVGE